MSVQFDEIFIRLEGAEKRARILTRETGILHVATKTPCDQWTPIRLDLDDYEKRVRDYELQGMTTSDAQAAVDAEILHGIV